MAELLDSEEAARRLGIKLSTLYAYVSRGLIESHPEPGGRRRQFDRGDVERLAARSRQGKAVETRLATVVTAITHLDGAGPRFRGRRVDELAAGATYEEVASLLWDDGAAPTAPWAAHRLELPAGGSDGDRIRHAVVASGGSDPFRFDLRPDAFTAAGRRAIATAIDVLPVRAPGDAPLLALPGRRVAGSLAGALAERLSERRPTAAVVAALNAAMVVMADHELTTATLAARVAASVWADLYGTLLAGLGAMPGRLHGAASNDARALLHLAHEVGAERAVADGLADGRRLPGFGHTLYPMGDPRCAWLLDRARPLATDAVWRTVCEVRQLAGERGLPGPNVDYGLAALTWAARLVPDAGETVATVARMAGWIAHALEEHREPPLRFRVRAVYATTPSRARA